MKKKWNSLPPDARKVIEDMSRGHGVWTGDRVDGIKKAAVIEPGRSTNTKLSTFPIRKRRSWLPRLSR